MNAYISVIWIGAIKSLESFCLCTDPCSGITVLYCVLYALRAHIWIAPNVIVTTITALMALKEDLDQRGPQETVADIHKGVPDQEIGIVEKIKIEKLVVML